MKKLFAALILALPLAVSAATVSTYEDQGYTVTLTDEACSLVEPAVEFLLMNGVDTDGKGVVGTIKDPEGKVRSMCVESLDVNGTAALFFSDASGYVLLKADLFKPVK